MFAFNLCCLIETVSNFLIVIFKYNLKYFLNKQTTFIAQAVVFLEPLSGHRRP